MVCLLLLFAALFTEYVHGRPPLPPLPMKDGCYVASSEVEIFRVEGEAVILSFPMFARVLQVRNIVPPKTKFIITKDNGTEVVAQSGGRVQQSNKQLWLLPANASDSGEYSCTYRNDTYCVTGSINLHVYELSTADMEKLSFPITATVGEKLTFRCPSISDFNNTDRPIEWHKDSRSIEHQPDRRGSFHWENGKLLIPTVKQSHAGLYTCQLRVVINDRQYKVSRAILLHVEDPAFPTSPTVPDLSITSNPALTSSYSTVNNLIVQPPVITSPLNGSIFETVHGSGLEIFCRVLTECQMADSTDVAWLVNGQSVGSSYMDGRALQGGRRVTELSERCQIELRLTVVAVTEDDVKTVLKCVTQNQAGRQEVITQLQLEDSTFTWLVVAVVGMSFFLTVVSVFLYVLFKPKRKKKMDYFLARQNSTF